MRKILRPVLVFLAIIFLIEAWLWDKLEPIVARIVSVIPWVRLKAAFARLAQDLPPSGTLLLFLVPQTILIPVKIVEIWFFMNGQWVEGLAALLFAKLFFVGTTAFVFDVTRDKLMQLDWFRGLYDYIVWLRMQASALVAPIKRRIRRRLRILMPGKSGRAFRLMMKIRRRMHLAEPQPQTDP